MSWMYCPSQHTHFWYSAESETETMKNAQIQATVV